MSEAPTPSPIMEMSDQIDAIAKVLPKAQAAMGDVIKKANNPAFKSKYADLGAVIEAVVPALNQHGITLMQPASFNGELASVGTMLLHESGQWVRCTLSAPLQKRDAQGIGSACTYLRRYGLLAMSGAAPEDDDGNAASGQRQDRQPAADQRPITAEQAKEIDDLLRQTDTAPKVVLEYCGVRTVADIPASAYATVKARLEARRQKEAA